MAGPSINSNQLKENGLIQIDEEDDEQESEEIKTDSTFKHKEE